MENVRVHLDAKLVSSNEIGVAALDAVLHPLSECVTNGGKDHVSHPLPWQLVPLLFDRHVLEALRVLLRKGKHLLH